MRPFKQAAGFLAIFSLLVLLAQNGFAGATEASLILDAQTARPGDTILAGLRLKMAPGWHTYWRNPGDSGIATSIKWDLPANVTAGEIQWPVPEKFAVDELTTYIYSREVVLLVPLKISANAVPGPALLKGKVRWLECNTQCIPGSAEVQATLNIGNETKPSADSPLIHAWQEKVPKGFSGNVKMKWAGAATNEVRSIAFEWRQTMAATNADFFPYNSDSYSFLFPSRLVAGSDSGEFRLEKSIKKLAGDWPAQISGLLVSESAAGTVAVEVNSGVADGSGPAVIAAPVPSQPSQPFLPARSLLGMLLYAFLGGLILNIMPCVLPVIALKILGFVNQGAKSPQRVRKLGLIYALGVLVSFLALAAMVIAVKVAGHEAGWGMQFGNPQFIVVMTVVVTLVALNLFGVFEVNLGGKVMGAAGELSAKEGSAGAFFNGILATLLATPCTAPFLGVALGFAFTQSYGIIILMFLTVGLGLALPYVILSWNPALLQFLPKPGAWMEKFKIAMGFPMLATAFWLFELTTVHYGKRVLWLGIFLVTLSLAAWIYGEFVQRGRKQKGVSLMLTAVILLGAYFYMLEDNLRWRSPLMGGANVTAQRENRDGIDWQPWSSAAVSEARVAGHPVLVDFTADWCAVCQVNRKTSIDIQRVQEKLKAINAVALEGDDTLLPESITLELKKYGRAGVPLVLVYSANPNAAPEILPDGYLTPSIVLGALERAAHPVTNLINSASR